MTAISTMPNSPSASPGCRCRAAGHAVGIRPLHRHSRRASWRSCRESRCSQFEKERLLDPLGMTDTGFFVTDPAKLKLIAQPMPNDSDFRVGREHTTRRSQEDGNPAAAAWSRPWRTIRAFCADAAQRRQLDGKTISQSEGVRTDDDGSVGPGSGVERDYFYFPGDGFGFGLGFARAHRSRQRQAAAAGLARRTEMGRRQRLLFRDRPQAGHVLRAAGADADRAPAHPAAR